MVPRFIPARSVSLSKVDLGFAFLRVLALGGGIGWAAFSPVPHEVRLKLFTLLTFFAAYSILLYSFILRWPNRVRKFYLAALVLDLLFVFRLLNLTGGIESSFTVALYLLVALHSFYYGLGLGVLVAVVGAVLCYLSDLGATADLHWTNVAVKLSFLFLVGVSLGLFSEKERRDRARIDQLNRECDNQTASLRTANESLKRMHERLLHSERLAIIGKMSAQIAHEIRNPLSSISLNSELLGDEIDSVENLDLSSARELLASIHEQVEILTHVIEDYLRFARIPEIRPEHVSLNALISAILEMLGPEFRQGRVDIVQKLSPEMPQISLDSRQFRIALVNILRNSIEAMPHGGLIEVHTQLRDHSAVVELSDTGHGIPPQNTDKIFSPFFTTKDNGTGLGLSLAQQIIEKHGGDISFRSAPGSGTSFFLELPLSSRSQEESA